MFNRFAQSDNPIMVKPPSANPIRRHKFRVVRVVRVKLVHPDHQVRLVGMDDPELPVALAIPVRQVAMAPSFPARHRSLHARNVHRVPRDQRGHLVQRDYQDRKVMPDHRVAMEPPDYLDHQARRDLKARLVSPGIKDRLESLER